MTLPVKQRILKGLGTLRSYLANDPWMDKYEAQGKGKRLKEAGELISDMHSFLKGKGEIDEDKLADELSDLEERMGKWLKTSSPSSSATATT
tara:strand:+ start:2928 stop:3203 length:276 start_codon:yes stop_codon:yes gene_type:complete